MFCRLVQIELARGQADGTRGRHGSKTPLFHNLHREDGDSTVSLKAIRRPLSRCVSVHAQAMKTAKKGIPRQRQVVQALALRDRSAAPSRHWHRCQGCVSRMRRACRLRDLAVAAGGASSEWLVASGCGDGGVPCARRTATRPGEVKSSLTHVVASSRLCKECCMSLFLCWGHAARCGAACARPYHKHKSYFRA